jgi:hypothetical protein
MKLYVPAGTNTHKTIELLDSVFCMHRSVLWRAVADFSHPPLTSQNLNIPPSITLLFVC